MVTKNKIFSLVILLVQLVSVAFSPIIPVSGTTAAPFKIAQHDAALVPLESFISSVKNGNKNQVVGIYAPGKFAQTVEAQPAANPAYVSTQPDVLTQFSTATKYGSLGFVAHNYLAGNLFFNLNSGDSVVVVFGDGNIQNYRIYNIRHFRAMSPNDPYSNFKDLDSTNGKILSAEQLFFQTYGLEDHLIFQTCIEKDGESSWGRLFVLAIPLDEVIARRQVSGVSATN